MTDVQHKCVFSSIVKT